MCSRALVLDTNTSSTANTFIFLQLPLLPSTLLPPPLLHSPLLPPPLQTGSTFNVPATRQYSFCSAAAVAAISAVELPELDTGANVEQLQQQHQQHKHQGVDIRSIQYQFSREEKNALYVPILDSTGSGRLYGLLAD